VSNKFKQIVLIDVSSLQTSCLDHLSKLSDGSLIFHAGLPRDLSETEKIIGAADCLIVSLLVPLPKDVFKKNPSLRYVCVYGTSTRRIDIDAAKASGVHCGNPIRPGNCNLFRTRKKMSENPRRKSPNGNGTLRDPDGRR
jgi:hypothetical protein